MRVLVTIATKSRSLRAARPKELRDFHHGDDGVRAKVHDPALAVLKGKSPRNTCQSTWSRQFSRGWKSSSREKLFEAGDSKQTVQTDSEPRF